MEVHMKTLYGTFTSQLETAVWNYQMSNEDTLSSYHYSMKEEQKRGVVDLVDKMQDVARSQLRSHLGSIGKESVVWEI